MNQGPLVFLAAFCSLAGSWYGFVLQPQMQVGRMQQTNTLAGATYPVARPGLAQEGLQVYRANGCAYCHSQQVGQTGAVFDILLAEPGTNRPVLIEAMRTVKPGLSDPDALQILDKLPKELARVDTRAKADAAVKTLRNAGAKAQFLVVPVGPDIARGWGKRRTVAEDFLMDAHVPLGAQRIGPDLASVGVRQPDLNWHLRHLYAPGADVKGSTMPAYRFFFERRKITGQPSADALVLPAEFAVPAGYEIVPRPEAVALAAYLVSLRTDAPLYTSPLSVASAAPAATNAPAGTPASK